MKRYLILAASLLLTGTANGQTLKMAQAQTQGNKVTYNSGKATTTIRTDSKGRTSTTNSYTSPSYKVTYGKTGNVGTVLQSSDSYANMPKVGGIDTIRAEPNGFDGFSIRVNGKEKYNIPQWGILDRMDAQRAADKIGQTHTVYRGANVVAVFEPTIIKK